MSILLNPGSLNRRSRPMAAAGWFLLYFVIVIVGGAVIGAWLIRAGLAAEEGSWHQLIDSHGPSRILRRLQTLLAILLAPVLLKKIGWGGARDLGWHSGQSREQRKKDFIHWFVLGVAGMLFLFTLALSTDIRAFNPFDPLILIRAVLVGFLIRGLFVALIEETLMRGVLYRSLASTWTPWMAAVVTSLLFAWAHFMKASPESFETGIRAVLTSALFSEFDKTSVPLKFFNMFLFGIVLSRLVHHRGDIWAAVGLHAAAVGCIKTFSKLTDFVPETGYRPWLGGHSSKFDDGWMLAVLLCVFLFYIEAFYRRAASSSRVHF